MTKAGLGVTVLGTAGHGWIGQDKTKLGGKCFGRSCGSKREIKIAGIGAEEARKDDTTE